MKKYTYLSNNEELTNSIINEEVFKSVVSYLHKKSSYLTGLNQEAQDYMTLEYEKNLDKLQRADIDLEKNEVIHNFVEKAIVETTIFNTISHKDEKYGDVFYSNLKDVLLEMENDVRFNEGNLSILKTELEREKEQYENTIENVIENIQENAVVLENVLDKDLENEMKTNDLIENIINNKNEKDKNKERTQ